MPQEVTYTAVGATNANTEIDLSNYLDGKMDVRDGVDPIVEAQLTDTSGGSAQDLTTTGQGAAGDPAAGEIVVVNGHTVALGDALADADSLSFTYEAVGEHEVPV